MKTLFALIILVAVGYVGFQYAYPPLMDMIGLEKAKPVELEIPQPVIVNVEPPPRPKKEEPKAPEMATTPEPMAQAPATPPWLAASAL